MLKLKMVSTTIGKTHDWFHCVCASVCVLIHVVLFFFEQVPINQHRL